MFGALGLGFGLFVFGGLFAGWVVLQNLRELASLRPARPPQSSGTVQVQVPGGLVLTLPEPPPLIQSLPAISTAPTGPSGERPAQAPFIPLPDWTDRERVNILLLGIDHRDGEPIGGSRSDTVMVVSIDPPTRSVVMISLPRDLWIPIPGFGEQRINVAHAVGGPELAMRTVTANFNIRIQHYARIDFRGFEQMVDALGGVFVDVEKPVKDDEYPTEDYGVMRLYISPGPQWMDGQTALQYARSRHSENDFGRARRQQRVLMAVRERAVQANFIFKAWELVPLAQKTVTTDLGPLDLAKLAKLATQIDRDRVYNVVIDSNYVTPFTTGDGASVLLPNRAAIQGAINQALARTNALPTPTPVATTTPVATAVPTASVPPTATVQIVPTRIEVLNGTPRQGLARSTADWLLQRGGVEITRVDSADRADYAETRLLYQPGREAAATGLANLLGLAPGALQALPSSQPGPDVRLILGQNYQLPSR